MSNLHERVVSSDKRKPGLPEIEHNISRSRKARLISAALDDASRATSKGGMKGEMRRGKASRQGYPRRHHEAGVPIKRAIRPVLRRAT